MRIAIGGLYQESHSFSPAPSDAAAFRAGNLLYGDDVVARLQGLNHEIAGAIEALSGHTCLPTFYAATGASGMPIAPDLLDTLIRDLIVRLENALPVDGVFLAMHGATVGQGEDDPTGLLLAKVRDVIGPDIPLVASLDLHANVTRAMARYADGLVGYHTSPHIDQMDTGARAGRLLLRAMEGARLTTALSQIPMVVPSENGRTTDGPYAEVIDDAIALESTQKVLSASVFCVQPWLDLPEMGCSTVVVTEGDHTSAQREADRLAQALWDRRDAFTPDLASVDVAFEQAFTDDRRPYVFSDASDAPSSGAPGDSTVLIEAALSRGPKELVYTNVLDPACVAEAARAGIGNRGQFSVGASLSDAFYRPVTFAATVKTLFDGTFRFKGPGMKGVEFQMGRTAVLAHKGLRLVVMERPVMQWDPELYRCVGLEPRDAKIVVAKSPAAFRAAYGPFAAEILNVDCPGVCSPNLVSFPWKRVTRPIYPLDDHAEFVVP